MMTLESTPNPPILTVSQLTQAIKLCLEGTFPYLSLQGEISNFKPHSSGHLYFSLKDATSQIGAVMFRPDALALKTLPKDGMQVVVKGELNVYPPSGKYQIMVKEMRPVGLGELLLKLEELKVKLHKKGWFKAEHKKSLPKFPKKIGVVTSPTGAAIQDIINILKRRFSGFHLILYPVRVQGEGAGQEIAQAIRQFNLHNLADVLIVGRGGGSIEDLWAFNEEIVAEAIFNSVIPIISAVGHETDHCIADYVADVRAPTPSAAAEIVIAEKAHQLHHLETIKKRLQHSVLQLIRKDRQRLFGILRHPLLSTPYGILGFWAQKLDDSRHDLDQEIQKKIEKYKIQLDNKKRQLSILKPTAKLQHLRHKLCQLEKNLKAAIFARLKNFRGQFNELSKRKHLDSLMIRSIKGRRERLEQIQNSLAAIDPKNLLSQGYCILFSEKDHSAITSVRNVEKHQEIRLMLADGEILSTVKEIFTK